MGRTPRAVDQAIGVRARPDQVPPWPCGLEPRRQMAGRRTRPGGRETDLHRWLAAINRQPLRGFMERPAAPRPSRRTRERLFHAGFEPADRLPEFQARRSRTSRRLGYRNLE